MNIYLHRKSEASKGMSWEYSLACHAANLKAELVKRISRGSWFNPKLAKHAQCVAVHCFKSQAHFSQRITKSVNMFSASGQLSQICDIFSADFSAPGSWWFQLRSAVHLAPLYSYHAILYSDLVILVLLYEVNFSTEPNYTDGYKLMLPLVGDVWEYSFSSTFFIPIPSKKNLCTVSQILNPS